MEVAARLGGGHDAELCRAALGVDLNALAVEAALGGRACDDKSQAVLRALSEGATVSAAWQSGGRARRRGGRQAAGGAVGGAAIVFLVPPSGRLVAVDGVDEAETGDGVEWVRVYHRPGHVFGELRRGADRAGAVLATGADRAEALARARRAADAVRFRVDADAP